MTAPCHIEPVARELLGEPNPSLSKPSELRYGNHGSLSIDLDRNVWHDHERDIGGGVFDLIADKAGATTRAAQMRWMEERGLGTPKQGSEITYSYADADGQLLFQVVRKVPKCFRQRRPDNAGGWIWNVKGIPAVPYRLPELLAAPADAVVYVVEGEKDVDRLASLGLVATCNAGGAEKWRADHAQHLVGRKVAILPDNDDAGRRHAQIVLRSLQNIAADAHIIELPGLPEKGDISDWLDAGGTVEKLQELKPAERPTHIQGGTDEPFSLSPFALNGRAADMEKQMLDDKFILGRMAILGQATVFYASRNAGKTLLMLRLLIDAIEAGEIEGGTVFYINADDNFKGLVTKLKLSERHGFHMLAPGHNEFKADMLPEYMERMIEAGTARGCILILDTLKKFADLMDKRRGSEFGKSLREFVMHGGSVIALAHVNKHRDSEGKVIFSGTSDIPDDVDAVYTADVVEDNAGTRTVLFENQKSRGDNAATASYTYTKVEGATYEQLLDSVRSVSEAEAEQARKTKQVADRFAANLTVIQAICDAIAEGTTLRTELIAAVKASTNETKKRITSVLDEHTGESPMLGHRWTCEKALKNAQIYHRLDPIFGGKMKNRAGSGKLEILRN